MIKVFIGTSEDEKKQFFLGEFQPAELPQLLVEIGTTPVIKVDNWGLKTGTIYIPECYGVFVMPDNPDERAYYKIVVSGCPND